MFLKNDRCTFGKKSARRVSRAETRLTVYRPLSIIQRQRGPSCMFEKFGFFKYFGVPNLKDHPNFDVRFPSDIFLRIG